MRGLRFLSLVEALLYNSVYTWLIFEFFYELFWRTNSLANQLGPVGGLFVAMVSSYNMVLHFPIYLTNLAIIVKELALEFSL